MRIEDVYGYIALSLENGRKRFTQKGLAERLKGSISTVNYALKPLERIGCIYKGNKGFEIMDWEKFLVYWAVAHRQIIEYATHAPENAEAIEAGMPSPSLFTAYSGAKLYYNINPSDYGEVYVYGGSKEIAIRFPKKEGAENIICLAKPAFLANEKKVPLSLIYVDLFNMPKWYAKEFLKEVEERLHGILE